MRIAEIADPQSALNLWKLISDNTWAALEQQAQQQAQEQQQKSAAKAKFKVYPSAYANGFAVQVCKGKMKGLDGKKRCSPPYC